MMFSRDHCQLGWGAPSASRCHGRTSPMPAHLKVFVRYGVGRCRIRFASSASRQAVAAFRVSGSVGVGRTHGDGFALFGSGRGMACAIADRGAVSQPLVVDDCPCRRRLQAMRGAYAVSPVCLPLMVTAPVGRDSAPVAGSVRGCRQPPLLPPLSGGFVVSGVVFVTGFDADVVPASSRVSV